MSDNNDIKTVEELANMKTDVPEAPDPAEHPEAYRDPQEEPVVTGPSKGEVKDINAVDDDHPLVQETGDAALKTQTESGAGEFLSDFIYEHDSAWVREWLQNEETACVRAAKLLVRMSDKYPDGWLSPSMWVDTSTGETVLDFDEPDALLMEYGGDAVDLRRVEVARPIDEVLLAARGLGYDPTIEWEVYLDERKIITTDNGIGMTPNEFDEAFNTIFNSGAGVDGETGGQFGVGSESSALVHGNDGGAEVDTRSRRPTKDGEGYDGFRAYSYLGGANALPGEVEEGFMGTKFDIPVQESFNLSKLQGWVEDYSEKLRVPLKYDEYDAGSNPVDEEYEATNFVDDYNDPPVVVERPGEFSVVAGPDVIDTGYHADDEDTFLVSMPIDRNTRASINTFWNVCIQIHDEQGRIVMGPHRGLYADGSKVYESSSKRNVVGDMDSEDIMLPQPTGDRDRLQKDSESKAFFNYIQEVVKGKELEVVSEIAERMEEADHPADAIRGEKSDWTLFKKMIDYHGDYHIMDNSRTFKQFLQDRSEFPDYDKKTRGQIWGLFKEVEHCHRGPGSSAKKSRRKELPLGDILCKNDPEEVYMAASTGGKFTQRFRVVDATYDNPEVIVIKGASKYDKWSRNFGFKVLKEVPVTQPTDDEPHDYVVSDKIHESNINRGSKKTKPDKVSERTLKIRTNYDNSSIDLRLTISGVEDRLESDMNFGGHEKLVLFPRSEEANISSHYSFAEYAAIASVTKKEYDALVDYDSVMTYGEYCDWSKSALIATEDGAKTPGELVRDGRMVILAYRSTYDKEIVKLLGDDLEDLREYYAEDIRDQFSWAAELDGYEGGFRGDDVGEVPDDEKDDTLFAVACSKVLSRAEWAFNQMETEYNKRDIIGLKLTGQRYKHRVPCEWKSLTHSTKRYRLMADTPNWDDGSDVYELFPRKRDSWKAQVLLGFHDRDIDPSEKDPDELRDLIN